MLEEEFNRGLSPISLPRWGLRGLHYLVSRKPFLPPILNFLVTDRCTLECRHCFVRPSRSGRAELSLAEIEEISKHLGPLVYLVLAGGEPFLREDLVGIVEAFTRNNGVRNVIILTDGQLAERIPAMTERILRVCPDLYLTIGVSLDGMERTHDRIRGRAGAFSRAVETCRGLAVLRNSSPWLDLQTCSVLMSENQERFDDLLDFIRDEIVPDKVTVNLIRRQPRDGTLLNVSIDRYEAITNRIREETFRGRFKNKYFHDRAGFVTLVDLYMHGLIARTCRAEKAQLSCRAGKISAVLTQDGDLAPCELLPAWGNLRQTGYRAGPIWFSPSSDKRRRRIHAGCSCTHESDCFLPSIPFSPRHYPGLAKVAYQWKKAAQWKDVN